MINKKIALVAGTRPEVIKLAPIYRAIKERTGLTPIWISTGQHRQMLDQALAAFEIVPDFDLDLMTPNQKLPELTARIIPAVADILRRLAPSVMLVQGDTTTVLGASLAAFYESVPIGHVEAGLRTRDILSPFPEEMNRRLTTPLARWNFCPTERSQMNLVQEAVDQSQCFVTGNSVIDALLWTRNRIRDRGVTASDVAERVGIRDTFVKRYLDDAKSQWVLVTGHRRESFGGGFARICSAIDRLTKLKPGLGVLYPVHLNPNVQEPVNRLLGNNPQIALVGPASYEDFVWLLDRCTFALSDSGGVQEEAPSLGKPVLVMRDTTERPEGVEAGTCRLVGTDPDMIVREASILLEDEAEYSRRSSLRNPYGDGLASQRIVDVLSRDLSP